MNIIKPLFGTLVLALLITSCAFKDPIVFEGVKGVEVISINNTSVNIAAIAMFNNPNEIGGKLKKVEIAVMLSDDTLAFVSQKKNLRINKNAKFEVPFEATLSMKEIRQGLVSNLFSILGGQELKLRFLGDIKISSHGITRKVPVDFESEIKL